MKYRKFSEEKPKEDILYWHPLPKIPKELENEI